MLDEFVSLPRVAYFSMEIALRNYAAGDAHHAGVRIMKAVIAIDAAYFNSRRMMCRYATEAYLR
jgi:hypothetical protein